MSVKNSTKTALISFFQSDGKKYIDSILNGASYIILDLDELDTSLSESIINNAYKSGIINIKSAIKETIYEIDPKIKTTDLEIGVTGNVIPFEKIHDIASENIGKLVRIRGMVNRTQYIKPMATIMIFRCRGCQELSHPVMQQDPFIMSTPSKTCLSCGERVSYDIVPELSTYIDSQTFSIQESQEDVSGEIPRLINLYTFRKFLINKVYCGDIVEIIGMVRLAPSLLGKSKSRFLIPYIDVLNIIKKNKNPEDIEISEVDEMEIINLSQQDNIYNKLIYNIAPSIYGMEKCKEACLLAMFGGVEKHKPDITIRGNIHVLMVGDPSVAKSQLLKASSELAPRGLFSSGRGATAAGLTAALNKDDTGEWVIDAGVLVLADKGIACIDEIDKMRDEDRVNIHEAMAQQTVTLNKAGRHAILKARTAVLAAANPRFGRYDTTKSVFENMNKFPPSLFSRFDLIFILIDDANIDKDMKVSHKIIDSETPESIKEVIDRELVKKYIAYSKRITPKIMPDAKQMIIDFFLNIRKTMSTNGTEETIPITYRQLEALARLTEAHARALLKQNADSDDAKAAIKIFKEFLEDIQFDATGFETGKCKNVRERGEKLYNVIHVLQRLHPDGVRHDLIISEGRKEGLSEKEVTSTFTKLYNDGLIVETKSGYYRTS
jgi:replicative DNA helicase Mcm